MSKLPGTLAFEYRSDEAGDRCWLAGGDASTLEAATASPIPMVLACPTCHERHVDEGEWATRPHKTHLCSRCGALFRPANVPTVGVAVLPEA